MGLLEYLGIAKALFIGHSLGGSICLKLVLTRPYMARAIVLANAAGIFPPFSLDLATRRHTAIDLLRRGDPRGAVETLTRASFSNGFVETHPSVYE